MLDTHFLVGFADELTLEKTAAHPLLSVVSPKATALGRKLRGMVSRKAKLGKKRRFRMKKRADANATTMETKPKLDQQPKPLTPPTPPKPKPMPSLGGQQQTMEGKPKPAIKIGAAGEVVRRVMEESLAPEDANERLEEGAEDTKYGGGLGNFKGKKAKPFTDKVNPTDMPGAFGKKATGYMPSARFRAGANKLSDTEMRVMEQAQKMRGLKKKAKAMCGPKYGCGKGKHGTGCGLKKKAEAGAMLAHVLGQ